MSLTVLGANGFIGYNLVNHKMYEKTQDIIAVSNNSIHDFSKNILAVNYNQFFNKVNYDHTVQQVIIYAVGSFSSRSTMSEVSEGVAREKELLRNVFQKLRASKIDKATLVFMSSGGAIYGNVAKPQSELDPTMPVTPYGVGKLQLENYVREHFEQCGYKCLIIRPSNIYGPYQTGSQGQGVVPIFIERILAGRPIKIFQSGHLLKDYIFINDFCECVRQLIINNADGVFNIGSGLRYSALDIANFLRVQLNPDFRIETEKNVMADVLGYSLDLRKIESTITYKSQTEITIGIQKTIEWYRSQDA